MVPLRTLGGTSQQEPCDTNVPLGLVPGTLLWTYFWAFLGHRGGTRVAPGTVPLRNPKGTSRKACLENPDVCTNSTANQAVLDGVPQTGLQVATLNVRKGAADALKKGFEEPGKVK